MPKKILAITAHPDDHVTFAGTVMKLQDQGWEYYEILLTAGEKGSSTLKLEKSDSAKVSNTRLKEFNSASKFLNTKKTFFLNQQDQGIEITNDLIYEVVKIVRELKPTVGISMNTKDIHQDHVAAATVAREAFRWSAKGFKSELGKPHRTDIALFAEGTNPIQPQVLVDITKYYARKEKLFKKYLSQSSTRDLDLLKALATIRGYHTRREGLRYAEGFITEEAILPILFDES